MTVSKEKVSVGRNNDEEGKSYSRRSTKIQEDFALFQETILFVQLDKLERGTGTIAFLLGKFVPFVQTAFAVLLLYRHCGGFDGVRLSTFLFSGRRPSPIEICPTWLR